MADMKKKMADETMDTAAAETVAVTAEGNEEAAKAEEKAAEEKEVVKAEEKAAEAEEAVKAEENAAEAAEPKKPAKARTPRKSAEKKPAEKKSTEKKPAEKKDAKAPLVPEMYIQFQSQQADTAQIIEKIKKQYISEGHRTSSLKSLQVYVKPEDLAVYYVINRGTKNESTGKMDLF